MATIQDLLDQYRPSLNLEEPVSGEEAIEYIEENFELDPETVKTVLDRVQDMLYWFLIRGRPVELPAVGKFRPTIDLDGTIRAALEADEVLVAKMSEPDAYRAGIDRRENIGADIERLAQMWNSTHPNDPVKDI